MTTIQEALGTGASVTPMSAAVDYDTQFVSHLADVEALRYFVSEGVHLDLLATPNAKAVYAFAVTYYEESGQAPSLSVLRHEFPQGVRFLKEIDASPQWVLTKLRQRYKESRIQTVIRDAARMVKTPDDAYSFIRDQVTEIEAAVSTKRYTVAPEDFEQHFLEYQEDIAENRYAGATTGFREIDEFMGGLRRGTLNIVLARPKRFKTFFLINKLVAQARQGIPSVLYTLELTPKEIERRLWCIVSGFSYWKLERGHVTPEDLDFIRSTYEEFRRDAAPHFVIQTPPEDRIASNLIMEADRLGVTSILIDQLSFLNARKKWSRHDLEIQEILRDLKNAATRKGNEKIITLAAQLNRTAAQQETMADISQAALSDAIGQTADTCFCLHRTKDMENVGQVEYGIIAGRNHGTASWMIDVDLVRRTEFVVAPEDFEEVDED